MKTVLMGALACLLFSQTSYARNDFDGVWRSSRGAKFSVSQAGAFGIGVMQQDPAFLAPGIGTPTQFATQNFTAVFRDVTALPTDLLKAFSERDIRGVKLNVITSGAYMLNLEENSDGSKISGAVQIDFSIPDGNSYIEFSASAQANAIVSKVEPLSQDCPNVHRPRTMLVSLSNFTFVDKALEENKPLLTAVKTYLLSLGLRMTLNRLAYSETLVELQKVPSGEAQLKCLNLQDEFLNKCTESPTILDLPVTNPNPVSGKGMF